MAVTEHPSTADIKGSARALAIDVLLDQRLFSLDPERYDAFLHALDKPPAPGPKLRALLRRTTAESTKSE